MSVESRHPSHCSAVEKLLYYRMAFKALKTGSEKCLQKSQKGSHG